MKRLPSSRVTASRVAALLFLVVLLAAGCRMSTGPREGDLAPDFVLPDLAGNVKKLSNLRGTPVLVNLWATWCLPCLEEMPLLDKIVQEYGPRGLVVLGIAGDDDDTRVREFVTTHAPAFEVLLDPGGTVGTHYGITGYPETFLVDRDGRLVVKYVGPLPNEKGLLASSVANLIESTLKSSN